MSKTTIIMTLFAVDFFQTYGLHVKYEFLLWRPNHKLYFRDFTLIWTERTHLWNVRLINIHNQRLGTCTLELEMLQKKKMKWICIAWIQWSIMESNKFSYHPINTTAKCFIYPISVSFFQFAVHQLEGFWWVNWRHQWMMNGTV